jgi:Protein of unknown function (DUF3305)
MRPLQTLPIAVIMQRRAAQHRWAEESWSAIAVMSDSGKLPREQALSADAERQSWLFTGLSLELFEDDNESYHENWAAPSPKVFIAWRMEDGRAVPKRASVSYVDGTRMFDSGESADGVMMPPDIQAWLGAYLREHYTPPAPGGERRHGRRERS